MAMIDSSIKAVLRYFTVYSNSLQHDNHAIPDVSAIRKTHICRNFSPETSHLKKMLLLNCLIECDKSSSCSHSSLLTKSWHPRPMILRWHLTWTASSCFAPACKMVQVSEPYIIMYVSLQNGPGLRTAYTCVSLQNYPGGKAVLAY